MNENEYDDANISTQQTADTTEETYENDIDVDEVQAKLAKAEELANNYKIRAEKAEAKLKSPKGEDTTPKPVSSELSTTDLLVLAKSDISEEDIDLVRDYASFKKISVSEALRSTAVKAELKEREENRLTAQASHTGSSRKSNTSVSDDTLVSNARAGKLPESDADLARLIEARFNSRGK